MNKRLVFQVRLIETVIASVRKLCVCALFFGFQLGVAEALVDSDNQSKNALASDVNTSADRPNILLIVADDLGFSDIGSFGSEISTPNLDELAKEGVQLNNFYSASACSPTRSMLLSGTDNHLAGLGGMAESISANQKGKPGYEGYLNNRVFSMASLLKGSGYHTYMTGKWHLGRAEEQSPTARGFDKSFVLLDGGAGHFDKSGVVIHRQVAGYRENGALVAELPDDFYSSDFYTQRMMDYIEGDNSSGKPFFAYLAFTAPHWPLQAPDKYIEKYEGRYDQGYDKLRHERFERLKLLGLIDKSMSYPLPYVAVTPWEELSHTEKQTQSRLMAVYAAMIDNMDENIGKLIRYLKSTGKYENTFIFFMSDNGAEGSDLKSPAFASWAKHFDNTYENLGRKGSFASYGPAWAQAGTAPFKLYKRYTAEGGIKVPAIVSYPALNVRSGVNTSFTTVMDVFPTVMELAGVKHPDASSGGAEIYAPKGESMLSNLAGRSESVHGEEFVMGWELFGQGAVRKGDWKLLRLKGRDANAVWTLYNLAADPGEMNDLADSNPDKFQEMRVLWDKYLRENGVVLPIR